MGATRNPSYLKAFGKHLRDVRKSKNFSQEELAYECDMQLSQIGRLERGERNPTISTLRVLAAGLGVEPKVLLDFN